MLMHRNIEFHSLFTTNMHAWVYVCVCVCMCVCVCVYMCVCMYLCAKGVRVAKLLGKLGMSRSSGEMPAPPSNLYFFL